MPNVLQLRRLQNRDSYVACLTPNFVSFQLNLTASQRKGERPRQWERMYLGFSFFCRRAVERGHVSRQVTRNTKARGEGRQVLLSSVHPHCGVDGGANPRYFVMLGSITVVCQAATENQQKEGLGDKSSFYGPCCPCNADCWRKSLVHMASLWGTRMPPAGLQPGLKASLGCCTH